MDKKKQSNKIIIFIVIIVALLAAVGVGFGTFFILKNNSNRNVKNNSTYMGILEDGTYYIAKANKNIRFQIDNTDKSTYKLTDSEGNEIETTIRNEDDKILIEGLSSYEEGKTYTLELLSANFTEDILKDAKKVMFKIEESEKQKYKLNNNVKVVENNIEVSNIDGLKTLDVSNIDIKQNDIILLKDYTQAYKVSNIENNTATLETPDLADIYNEYDIHKEYKVDFRKIEINDEFKDQIKLGVKQTAIYQFLVNEVYAEDDVDVEVNLSNSGTNLLLNIIITAKANGDSFLGIKALSNHDLRLTFKIGIGCDFIADIQKDMNINLDSTLTESLSYDISLENTGTIIEGVDTNLPDDEYMKSIQEIVSKLESATEDETGGKARIGGIEVPTSVPGLNVYFDVYLQTQLGLDINFKYNQTIEMKQNVGILISKDEINYYSNTNTKDSNISMEAYGKANLKVGAGFDIGLSIISKDIAHIDIGDELGLYGELFATMKTSYNQTNNNYNNQMMGKIEAGLYVDVNFSAGIDVFFYKKDINAKLLSKKFPILNLGKEIKVSKDGQQQTTTQQTSLSQGNSNKNSNNKTENVGQQITVSGTTADDIYQYFLKNRMYREQAPIEAPSTIWDTSSEQYCMFDINKDGINELFVGSNDPDFQETLMYTCIPSKNQIIYMGDFYGYGLPFYDAENKELAYDVVRPSNGSGYLMYFGKIENNRYIKTKEIAGLITQRADDINKITSDFTKLTFTQIN